jgi:hypothetical protein
MSHFGWLNFWRLHAKQVAGLLPHVREREILKFLHRRSSLDVLARKVARLAPGFVVKVESVWVDGTPQATFIDVSGKNYNCEHELTENLRQSITVDWSARESVRATLRLMVKRILRKYKYPPDQQERAVELVLQQAEALGEAWA